MKSFSIGRLIITWTDVWDWGYLWDNACGCKMLFLGPLWIDWEYKAGCGNVPYESIND